MLETHPPRTPGRSVGLVLIVALILIDAGLLALVFLLPITLLTFFLGLLIFVSIPAFLVAIFGVATLSTGRYTVTGNFLVIEWGRLRRVVELSSIQSIHLGEEIEQLERFRGVRWPGYLFGRGMITGESFTRLPATFYATRPPGKQLLVVSDEGAIGLSPVDPIAFRNCLAEAPKADPDGEYPLYTSDNRFLGWPIWRDRVAHICLGVTLLINGALFALLTAFYSRLPADVPLHFDLSGSVDRAGSPNGLFVLPLIGLIAWILALVGGWYFHHKRAEPPVAYIVWGATMLIEVAAWVGVAGLINPVL